MSINIKKCIRIKLFIKIISMPLPQSIFIFVILVSILSCQHPDKNKINTIDLSDPNIEHGPSILSNYANKIEYLFLDSPQAAIFGEITDIVFSSNHILIYDETLFKVLLFDRQGKFICKISSRGKGPHEFIKISDITMNEEYNRILLATFENKILSFDLSGNFLNSIKHNLAVHELFDFGSFMSIIIRFPVTYQYDNCAVHFIDFDGHLIKRGLVRHLTERDPRSKVGLRNDYYFLDTLCIWESYFDTIWGINKNKEIIPRWSIVLPDEFLNYDDFFKDLMRQKLNSGMSVLANLYETRNFLFFESLNQNSLKTYPSGVLHLAIK